MSDERGPVSPNDHDGTGWVIFGAVLVVIGVFTGMRSLDILPWPLMEILEVMSKAALGIGLVLLGVALIVWAQTGRRLPSPPVRGRKLYRSRDDKWVAGVLGGLAGYFGVDVTLLRIAFLALTVMGMGSLIVAYIIMAIIVPYPPYPGTVAGGPVG